MFIEELENDEEWEEFVRSSPKGTFYHSLKWKKVIEKSFSASTHYLVVKDRNKTVIGVCPAFIFRYGPFKVYSSMPYSDFGGPIIKEGYVKKVSLLLRKILNDYCFKKGISYAKISFTDNEMSRPFKSPLSYVDTSTGIMIIDLKLNPTDAIWKKKFSRKQRYEIKRFERNGFTIREANTKSDLREFYNLYLSNTRYLKIPGYSYNFFHNIWDILFPKNFHIMLLEKEKCVGGLAQFKYGQGIYGGYVAMDRKWKWGRYSMMPYMLWKLIRWAEENGFRYVSLGLTPAYKRNPYYIQKIRFGATFLQQEKVFIPFGFNASVFISVGAKAISVWRIIKKSLPVSFKSLLERTLSPFFSD